MAFLGFTALELKTYLIMVLCWVEIVQVNLLEQPYARSLVVCDTPTNTTAGAEFSGSRFCGDRLHVINVGAEISGKGQSLENVGRIAITFFVSGFADRGRRRAAILGQFLLLVSTLMFFAAGFLKISLSIPIYTIAQGIQGMSGIGILDTIVTGDVALLSGDAVGVFNRKNTFVALMAVIFTPLVLYVQYIEISDFTWVWFAINLLNLATLVLLILFFPETLPPDTKTAAQEGSLLNMAANEIKTFYDLVCSNRLVKWRLTEHFLNGISDAGVIGGAFLMANFGMHQFQALLYGMAPGILLSWIFMPLVPALCRRCGYRSTWTFCYWTYKSWHILAALPLLGMRPLMLQSFFGGRLPGPIITGLLPVVYAGWPTVISAVELRLVGQAANAKFAAMMSLVGFVTGAVNSVLYTQLFDAEATTDFYKMLPYYVGIVGMVVSGLVYFFRLGPLHLGECDKLQAEEEDAAKEAAKETNGKANGEDNSEAKGDKKTD